MKIIKNIIKKIFCKHEYWFGAELSCTVHDNYENHIYSHHDLTCRCSKCGKEKTIIYNKNIE